MERGYYLPGVIADVRVDVCMSLLRRWSNGDLERARILKTDAFEEAFAPTTALLQLAARNGRITGMDISPVVVDKARRNARAQGVCCRFVACDVRELPFGDADFDTVFSHSTLDHFPRPSDLLVSLKELGRVLRPGGTLILTLDNRDNICAPLVRIASRTVSPFFVAEGFRIDELTRAMAGMPLRVEDATYIANSPRILDIALAKALGSLGSARVDRATRRAFGAFDGLLRGSAISRRFGTYIALKAVRV